MTKFLIAGLGNPGNEYHKTRHNIGFEVLDAFAEKNKINFAPGRLADVAEIRWKGKIFTCIKPTTYMNLSGKAVKYWLDKEKIELSNLLVIIDDLALPLSALRLRGAGSDGGHNGLKDIQATLNTTAYARLRFGIGNNYPKGMQADFVLGKWFKEEQETVNKKIEASVTCIENFAAIGLERTMNNLNTINFAG